MAQCPICGVPMEVVQTKSRLKVKQFAQSCRTHGRKTAQFTTAANATTATVTVARPAKWKEPT